MTKLFVRNVPFKASESDVFAAFQPFENLVEVKIPVDRESGQSRGYAFVTFGDAESADVALRGMHGAELMGRALGVEVARDRQ